MAIVIDTTNYKVEYDKALLTDALSSTTLRTKATLLAFAAVLLVVTAYRLPINQIPGLSVSIPPGSPDLIKGLLALSTGYLCLQFILCFLQDYFRWRLTREKANVSHSGKIMRDLQNAIDELNRKLNLKATHAGTDLNASASDLLKELAKGRGNIESIRISRNAMIALQFGKFWLLDFAAPLILSAAALQLSGTAAFVLIAEVWRVLCQ